MKTYKKFKSELCEATTLQMDAALHPFSKHLENAGFTYHSTNLQFGPEHRYSKGKEDVILSHDDQTQKPKWRHANEKSWGGDNKVSSLKQYLKNEVKNTPMTEDEAGAPTNNAGSGSIAGLGIGSNGEPGVPVRKKLKVVGPPVVDPRLFADKIFNRKPPINMESANLKWSHPLETLAKQHGFKKKGSDFKLSGSVMTRSYVHPSGQKLDISNDGTWRHSIPSGSSSGPHVTTSKMMTEPSFD